MSRHPVRVDIGGVKAVIAHMKTHRGAIISNNPTDQRGGNIATSQSKTRINLSDAVDDLAPAPPPCFLNKQHWIGYLKSAAAAQNQRDEPKIIIFAQGEPAINTAFDFCADCDTRTRDVMLTAQRCKPDWMQR